MSQISLMGSKDPSVQLEISKVAIECFFKELSDEIKGFKY